MRKIKHTGSFIKQAAILAVASLIVRIIGAVYRIPLTNLLGDEGNAFYSAGFTFYTFALIISSGALPAAISKLVSERLARKQYRNAHELFKISMWAAMVTGLAGSASLYFVAGWLARFSGYPDAMYSIRTLSPTIFIVAILAVYRGYFQGMQNAVPTAVSQVVEQVFNAILSILLAYIFLRLSGITAWASAGGTTGTGIGAFAGLLVVMFIYRKAKPGIWSHVNKDDDSRYYESRKKLLKTLARTAIPIIIGMSIFAIANLIDMTMIANRLTAAGFEYDDRTVMYGQFSGKYIVLATFPVSLAAVLATTVIPSLAMSKTLNDIKAVHKKINMALRLSMMTAIPAAVGLGVLAQPILLFLFPRHPDGARIVQYGVVSIVFLALTQIITGILQGIGKVNIPVIGAFFGMLVKIPLNWFLIAKPGINVVGAVISTTVCYMVAAGINMYFLHKYTGIKPDIVGAFVKPLLASVIMGLACYVSYFLLMDIVGRNAVATLGAIVVGMGMYGVYMVMIRGVKPEDLEKLPLGSFKGLIR